MASFIFFQKKKFESDSDSPISVSSEDSDCFKNKEDQDDSVQEDNAIADLNTLFQNKVT